MKNIMFAMHEFESVDDSNCDERASEQAEAKLLNAVSILIDEIDMRDNIRGNDFKLNHVKNLVNRCIEENNKQYFKNIEQQKVFDVKLIRQDRDIPLKAA